MSLGIKLEVFRRINEGGTRLTGQDIRLAYYSQSKTVTFIRLCGLHNDSQSSQRMLERKIWLQQNLTDRNPAEELVAMGVPKEDIVLGLQPPYKRPYTDYGVA